MDDLASSPPVTQLLKEVQGGDKAALDKLLPLVYSELRRLAAYHLRGERQNHTLQPTALVHEAYLRLVNQREVDWHDRAQFFGLASQMMRRILVNHALANKAAKRGGTEIHLALDAAAEVVLPQEVDLIRLDDALTQLQTFDPEQCRIVELRFFGGLTVEEVAAVVGISTATVKREWRAAKAWLYEQIAVVR